ncbi:AI-2E family transporter [Pseudomonas sp. ok266]|uniref:AI-2E family transporter n=1 Tax=Pseudomonas sp. ok266 TaxID=1761896 RepID=UPI0008B3B820|nr:AI-2E family transporter [Pseudomonas sp. ok266]SEN81466.1 Predicted PurR-regulated permease PerM [Pseudomonas sp. ok266]
MEDKPLITFQSSRALLDVLIRAGLITVLVLFCYDIFHPFLNVMLWALILAVTLYPLNQALGAKLGNRYGWAAIILVLLGLVILMLPLSLLGASIADSIKGSMHTFEAGQFEIPPPPASVEGWPLIGAPLYGIWMHASQDLSWVFQELAPHLKDWSKVVLHQAAGVGAGIVVFVIALIVAGLIMHQGERGHRTAVAVTTRISGPVRGPQIAQLCTATIRAVAQGVVGIAFIQMLLVGVALVVMGVPAAGVLALMVLLLGITQLPVLLITLPIVIYVFAVDGVSAGTIIFAVWMAIAGLADNVLKPMLLGRGVAVPMPVVLIGALGGMVTSGIIGLFTGPVILAVGYELFIGWVYQPADITELLESQRKENLP